MQSQKQFRAQIRKYLKRGFNVIVTYGNGDEVTFSGNGEERNASQTFSYYWRNKPNDIAYMKIVSFDTEYSSMFPMRYAVRKTVS